uniref:RHS repeat domain-containing protein n=1 Tax=Tenacibaculum halocynthiae TaxID=1254437 RepID=UPI003D655F49
QTNWNSLSVNTSGNPVSNQYTYSYDALNRITGATGATTSNYDVSGILYDKNGNITQLIRKGHRNAGATVFGNMDHLAYYYDNGNKLTKVHDYASIDYGFKDGNRSGNDYSYDVNGNMKTDANKGITNITYNHLNLPTRVTIGGQNIDYVYDASGSKLRKTVSGITTDYAGNHIYKNGALEFFNHSEGYVKPDNTGKFDYVYQYKDHLGNVRLSYTDNNKDGVITASSEIIEESNYYPFGLKHKGYNNITNSLGNSTAQKFGYQGVELEEGLGLNLQEMDFRQYDPSLGKFIVIDPMAEERNWLTPYNFVQNNPILRVDPSGLLDDYHTFSDGRILRLKTNDTTDSFTYHDSNGGTHNIGTFEKNSKGLINLSNINYNSSDGNTSVKVTGKAASKKKGSLYISGVALSSVIGASAESGEEVYITRASNADGSSPGDSKTHVNGKNIDLRFVGKNGSRSPLNYKNSLTNFNKIDATGSKKLNRGLRRFGYKSIKASTLNITTTQTTITPRLDKRQSTVLSSRNYSIPGTSHLKNHYDHQHLQGYRPRVTTRRKVTLSPSITPAGINSNF